MEESDLLPSYRRGCYEEDLSKIETFGTTVLIENYPMWGNAPGELNILYDSFLFRKVWVQSEYGLLIRGYILLLINQSID